LARANRKALDEISITVSAAKMLTIETLDDAGIAVEFAFEMQKARNRR
jgi:hypothetical protein